MLWWFGPASRWPWKIEACMRRFGILQHCQLRPSGHLTHLIRYISSIATTLLEGARGGDLLTLLPPPYPFPAHPSNTSQPLLETSITSPGPSAGNTTSFSTACTMHLRSQSRWVRVPARNFDLFEELPPEHRTVIGFLRLPKHACLYESYSNRGYKTIVYYLHPHGLIKFVVVATCLLRCILLWGHFNLYLELEGERSSASLALDITIKNY